MISEILGKSFEAQSNFEELLKNKLKATGLSKTRFERLSGIQRKSLDAILKKSSKQTNVVNLLKLGEFLELSLEELLILHFKDRPTDEIKALQ
ncbi:MAG: helix-turn-helix domain-containing protein, partial [Marinirhabdus sp.]